MLSLDVLNHLSHRPNRADSIETMKACLKQLSERLASDSQYFQQVYTYTFEFSRAEGQRSLGSYRFIREIHPSSFLMLIMT